MISLVDTTLMFKILAPQKYQPVMNELTFDEKCPKILISGGGFLRI